MPQCGVGCLLRGFQVLCQLQGPTIVDRLWHVSARRSDIAGCDHQNPWHRYCVQRLVIAMDGPRGMLDYSWVLTIFPFLRKLSLSQKLLVCLKIRAWGTVKTTTMESTQVCWYASVFQPWMKVSFVQTFALVSIFLMHFTMTLSTIDKNTSDLT